MEKRRRGRARRTEHIGTRRNIRWVVLSISDGETQFMIGRRSYDKV